MVAILLGTGFEESEALVPADLLRRAGIEVRLVGVDGPAVTSAHGVTVTADLTLAELDREAVDMLVREHEQHPDNPILFPSPRTGGYWSPDAVSRINRKLLEMAGIEEHVRFHDLRHQYVKPTTKSFSTF